MKRKTQNSPDRAHPASHPGSGEEPEPELPSLPQPDKPVQTESSRLEGEPNLV